MAREREGTGGGTGTRWREVKGGVDVEGIRTGRGVCRKEGRKQGIIIIVINIVIVIVIVIIFNITITTNFSHNIVEYNIVWYSIVQFSIV